ncbi:DUF4019 domain-containing protein [Novosphingobium sp. P6W]|uniref:DUF4019 domain-containing protein n=1 Tax=Novosphingobium sp. P6W TaxID=1609758 RepID=UPI0005C321C5|nr:DUF4019 domain-containing protein [Novosphingobium sp. P6W]AXB77184.1 DUF4019 domain-containing protein [Novosphingobium sp. P6W]KIS30865.1 hypothetical protein TQ38_19835 [Novosphingobium sp. P6W]
MNRLARFILPLTAAAMLAGCNVQASIREAEVEIGRFHQSLDAGNTQAVWVGADPDLRKATSRDQFGKLLDAVHRKLGKVKSSQQIGWNANATTGGSFVTVSTETTFERGTGTEQFVFRKGEADKLTLVGYDIQSQDMMMN